MILMLVFVLSMIPLGGTDVQAQDDVTIVLSTGVQTTTALTDIIARFNDKTQTTDDDLQFQVELQEGTWETDSQYDGYVLKLQAEDSTFDVISMDVIWPPDFTASGFLEPLDDVFPKSEQDKFLLAPIEAGTYEGSIYGAPWFHDSAMLYYRTDVIKAAYDNGIIDANRAPETWAELHDWSIAIVENTTFADAQNITAGFVWQAKAYEGLICDFMEYIGGTGTYSFLNDDQSEAIFDNQNIKDALAFMKSLIDDGASPEAVLTYTEEESRAVWHAGNAVFHRNWPYAYRLGLESVYLNGTAAGADDKVFDVTTMPAKDSTVTNPRTSCLGGWQLGVNKFSENKPEAKAFVMWLTAEEQQLEYFLEGGQTPTRKALYSDPAVTESDQGYVEDFFPIFDAALPRPVSPYYPAMSEKIRATINEYLGGSTTLDAAVEKMNTDVNTVIEDNQPAAGFETEVALIFTVFALGTLVVVRRRK